VGLDLDVARRSVAGILSRADRDFLALVRAAADDVPASCKRRRAWGNGRHPRSRMRVASVAFLALAPLPTTLRRDRRETSGVAMGRQDQRRYPAHGHGSGVSYGCGGPLMSTNRAVLRCIYTINGVTSRDAPSLRLCRSPARNPLAHCYIKFSDGQDFVGCGATIGNTETEGSTVRSSCRSSCKDSFWR
jgi:hypothetical protein